MPTIKHTNVQLATPALAGVHPPPGYVAATPSPACGIGAELVPALLALQAAFAAARRKIAA